MAGIILYQNIPARRRWHSANRGDQRRFTKKELPLRKTRGIALTADFGRGR